MIMTTTTRKEYLRVYQNEWAQRRRQEWVDANGPCAVCGSDQDLEVDHIDRSLKEIAISQVWGMSPTNPKRINELAKCQVLCHECHVEKTWTEDFERAQHGTASCYSNGCRLPECREAATIDRRRYPRKR